MRKVSVAGADTQAIAHRAATELRSCNAEFDAEQGVYRE
jgi:hypothetical protein